jgi:hypothetical protein
MQYMVAFPHKASFIFQNWGAAFRSDGLFRDHDRDKSAALVTIALLQVEWILKELQLWEK